MGCGCSGGGVSLPTSPQQRIINQNIVNNSEPCPYDINMMFSWRDILYCVRDNLLKDLYGLSQATLNSYLGIVISAINYSVNICYFKPQLDMIQPVIMQIINSGKCQE